MATADSLREQSQTNSSPAPRSEVDERRTAAWIGQGVLVEGRITSSQDLRIDGTVEGTIEVGNHVLIAHMVDIHDNNSHSLDWRDRREDALNVFERGRALETAKMPAAQVVIEDDVWIGAKSTIMKGVRIGRGAVVAAASVVTKAVPPFTLVAGNPARTLRELTP